MLEDGKEHSAEVEEKNLNGHFLVSTTPLFDQLGNISGCVHVARDITASKLAQFRIERLNVMKENLLRSGLMEEKLQLITDSVVEIFDADFARIWLIAPGDRCESGCYHGQSDAPPHVCQDHDHCLHLLASSGRYTHLDGKLHSRVPFGSYKIGKIASGVESKYLTNDVCSDSFVHDHEWAKELGLQSFAGYRLLSHAGTPIGVLALFSKGSIGQEEDILLEGVANATAQVIQTAMAEQAILEGRDMMQAIVDNVDAMIYITDIETYEILLVNKYIRSRFGNIEGSKCWQALQQGQDGPCSFCQIDSLVKAKDRLGSAFVWLMQNTIDQRWYECHDTIIRWVDNRLVRLQIATDITERKEAEEKLKEYGAVQKTLLQEVNHRVKNNLSAIISMLHMEEDRARKRVMPEYIESLNDLVARINGLATVHSLLSSCEWRPLALDYLCKEVAQAALHGLSPGKKIDLDVESSSVQVGSRRAHHLALVTNIGMEIVQGIVTSTLQGEINFNNDGGAVTQFKFKNNRQSE
jgi:two-component sensor histidine kinase